MSDLREFVEGIVYDSVHRRRYTQESPVMPDVWIQYALHPQEQHDLLMVPHWHHTAAELARDIRILLDSDRSMQDELSWFRWKPDVATRIAYNQNAVVASLWFDELVRAVLPLSRWWATAVCGVREQGDPDQLHALLAQPNAAELLAQELGAAHQGSGRLPTRAWLARLGGLIAYSAMEDGWDRLRDRDGEPRVDEYVQMAEEEHDTLAETLLQLLEGLCPVESDDPYPLYTVNLNRRTTASLVDSAASIKADAARRVFEVRGQGIRWAVVDSGIDARHVAFRNRGSDDKPLHRAFPEHHRRSRRGGTKKVTSRNETRIVATYDFVHVRDLLGSRPHDLDDPEELAALTEKFPVLAEDGMVARLRTALERLNGVHGGSDADPKLLDVDWESLEPFLQVPHRDPTDERHGYRPPRSRHGTHVAGILAADWRVADTWSADDAGPEGSRPPTPRRGDIVGVAPRIELYDLRVLRDDGSGDEFAIMSALQFVRDLNARRDFVAVHGVNLSFSIPHDVANYACGRTPVCEEAARLVGSGILVVAAAGNNGRARYLTPDGRSDDGFRTVSITDPGNTEAVITVGSTHRRDPHTYGVSYFSSRGPTGDGRLKPDLVAPGEKILSTVPDDGGDRLDGTSMAAPHVSGAAALIMSRHSEFIGQPARIKDILCATASDLKRERYFQGAGLLDILRALQSV